MKEDIEYLIDRLKPLGFKENNNILFGPHGVTIELNYKKQKPFCIKKYALENYSGESIIWGEKEGLDLKDTLSVLLQILIEIEW